MSLTPSNNRIMSPAWGGAIKLTPSNSPYSKHTPLRSPIKLARAEASLALKQVIGATAASANAFDSLATGRCFAFTAGAAAVVATVDAEHNVAQRFFRARPTTAPLNSSASIYGGPSTPTQNEGRNRTAASLRESGIGASPLASPVTDWSDSPSNKTWTARERIKAATCLSFSPDSKFLAVGETGYRPRVLIFSTAPDAPSDTPLTSLSDHTFGVRCLAFSPDSRYLASLGTSNDGFLYIWAVNSRTGAATLHSSNKCTSVINRITWLGNNVITVGTRHIKVWRVEDFNNATTKSRQSDASFLNSNTHKTLPGRNCILETLLDANFTSVVAAAPDKAVVATDKGDICLVDDSDGMQRFSKIADAGFSVTSMAVDSRQRLHVASSQGALKTLDIAGTIDKQTPPPSPPVRVDSPTICLTTHSKHLVAIGALLDYIVTVDSQQSIRLSHMCAADDESAVGDVVQKLPAHGDRVMGVAPLSVPNPLGASFFTWSAGGSVLFWTQEGICKNSLQVALEQETLSEIGVNELKIVRATEGAQHIITGDKYGILRIFETKTWTCILETKAHALEVTGIAVHENQESSHIALCSRDRTVQIFARSSATWDLMQTLDEHVGAVTGIQFSTDGKRLVTRSSDRTLVVRELVTRTENSATIRAFLIVRTIILKATPISATWDVDQDDVLLVSTIDRQVHKYDLRNGQCLSTFRASSDGDSGDSVVLSSLVHVARPYGPPIIAGISSTDKSIRLYEDNGALIARDWGHTEGISDITILSSQDESDADSHQKSLVTVAVDGTVFIWSLELKSHRQDMSKSVDLLAPNTPNNPDRLAIKPPLRRVFSQSELARFQRSPEEDSATPAGSRSPKLRKRLSKFSLAQTPKLEPSPISNGQRDARGSVSSQASVRRAYRNRSPSPPSPRNPQIGKRRSSVDIRVRAKPSTSEFGSIGASTESLCRTLRAYRKRLANSTDNMSTEHVREVERELALTARAVGEKAKLKDLEENVMAKLLDQYSERLVSMLDEKIAISVAQKVRENSVGGFASGPASPALDTAEDGKKGETRPQQGVVIDSNEKESHAGAGIDTATPTQTPTEAEFSA